MNLVDLLAAQARRRGQQPAIIEAGRREKVITFEALDEAATDLATGLRSLGLSPGSRILLLHAITIDLYIMLLATLRIGAIAVVTDPGAGRQAFRHCVRKAAPDAVFCGFPGQCLTLVTPELRRIKRKLFPHRALLGGFHSMKELARATASSRIETTDATAPALLTFTSGSTGHPKAAMRSHGFLVAQHRALSESIDLTPGETDMITLPVFVLANLASGVTSVIPQANLKRPGFVKPRSILEQMAATGTTRSAGSPAFYTQLANHLEARATTFPGLKKLYVGGAPVFPSALKRFKTAFPNCDPEIVYGSTEAEPMSHIRLSEIAPTDFTAMHRGAGLLVGAPVDDIALRIIQDQWNTPLPDMSQKVFEQSQCPTAKPGEIVVSGQHVLDGYLDGEGDEETKFSVDGTRWHRTGDAGYLDAQGRLWLLGRCSARIDDEQGQVYPFAVECAVDHYPWVRRSAFVERGGGKLLLAELTHDAPQDATATILASLHWARCTEVLQVKRIPLDNRHNAKIDYVALDSLPELRNRKPTPHV